eukprot:1239793-Rhodomonas_salina.1
MAHSTRYRGVPQPAYGSTTAGTNVAYGADVGHGVPEAVLTWGMVVPGARGEASSARRPYERRRKVYAGAPTLRTPGTNALYQI